MMSQAKTKYERKMESVLYPRRCKHHRPKKKVQIVSPQYKNNLGAVVGEFGDAVRAEHLRSLAPTEDTQSVVAHSVHAPLGTMLGTFEGGMRLAGKVAGAVVLDACELSARALKTYRGKRTKKTRASAPTEQQLRRRKYYARETAVRQAAAARLRAARPAPKNPMPTPEQLIHAYALRHVSEMDAIRFGELMIDLEEHAQVILCHEGNKIVNSKGGVRKWLSEHCPELATHYDTCQRFKRRAQEDPDFDDEDQT